MANAQTMMTGQVSPAADEIEDLATCPAGRLVHAPIVIVHNHDNDEPHIYSVIVAFAGAVTADKMYVATDAEIGPGATQNVQLPLTLKGGDVIRVTTDADELLNFMMQNPASSK